MVKSWEKISLEELFQKLNQVSKILDLRGLSKALTQLFHKKEISTINTPIKPINKVLFVWLKYKSVSTTSGLFKKICFCFIKYFINTLTLKHLIKYLSNFEKKLLNKK